jgi:hypothetical protein
VNEVFKQESKGENLFTLKGYNGKYLSFSTDSITCNATEVEEPEVFE